MLIRAGSNPGERRTVVFKRLCRLRAGPGFRALHQDRSKLFRCAMAADIWDATRIDAERQAEIEADVAFWRRLEEEEEQDGGYDGWDGPQTAIKRARG